MHRAIALSLLARLAASQSLLEVIAGQESLSALATVLEGFPELVETLGAATDITILAPNNEALAEADLSDLENIPNVLSYHVVQGTFRSTDFSETPVFAATLLQDSSVTNVTGGQVVKIEVEDDDVEINDDADVVTADIEFDGGIIHIIDDVLEIPPPVTDVLTSAGLSSLAEAATAADLVGALSTTPDLTIFAPTNEAFAAIADVAANLTTEELTAVLQYHVIAGTVAYSPGLETGSIETLQGSSVNITVSDDGIMVNDFSVTTADVLIANGVVHVINGVLIPPADGTDGDGDGDDNGDDTDGDDTDGDADGTPATPTPTTVDQATGLSSKFAVIGAGLLTLGMFVARL